MRKVQLVRFFSNNEGTPGVLLFGNNRVYTLELPWRDNAVKMSCIPRGTYRCILRQSPKFGLTYWLTNVPGRSLVLIHAGNLAGASDKGYSTNVEGCILTGLAFGSMRNKKGNMQQAVFNSKAALRKFMEWGDGKEFELEIT